MKIYKISAQFQLPATQQTDPNLNANKLQALNTSEQAVNWIQNIFEQSTKLIADIAALEEELGVGDIGLRNQTERTVMSAIAKTNAYTLLKNQGFAPGLDPNTGINTSQIQQLRTNIVTQRNNLQQSMNVKAPMNQVPK